MVNIFETATLAGGCFWGMEDLFSKLEGVISTEVGYTGGELEAPSYEKVKTGGTGHAESVQVVFDPARITYEAILEYFFRIHDPTTPDRQINDVGTQYRSAIFYHTAAQKEAALKAVEKARKNWKKELVTQVVPFSKFWKAEEYHQKYLKKNPGGYTCHFERKF